MFDDYIQEAVDREIFELAEKDYWQEVLYAG